MWKMFERWLHKPSALYLIVGGWVLFVFFIWGLMISSMIKYLMS